MTAAPSGSDRLRQIAVIVALAATIAMNALANLLPIGGRTTGEISDSLPVLFVPAGYVFAIWGLIYLALGVYAVYQALPGRAADPVLRRVGWPFVLSCALNVGWLLAWHNLLLPLSLAVMLGLLVTLCAIYLLLRRDGGPVARGERLAARAPFSLYLGWITVATVANASVVLYDLGWRGEGASGAVWASLMVAVATGIGVLMLARFRDAVFALVLVWAFAGIAAKHWGVPLLSGTAVAAAGLLALLALRAVAFGRGAERGYTPR